MCEPAQAVAYCPDGFLGCRGPFLGFCRGALPGTDNIRAAVEKDLFPVPGQNVSMALVNEFFCHFPSK